MKSSLEARNQVLTLSGCVLFVVSIALPVMRWFPTSVHSTSGSARVLGSDSWTLLDGGFAGSGLVPISAISVVVVAMTVLATRLGPWVWWARIAALALALYYPAWVLFAFGKKLEDQVFPAEGFVVLVLAFGAMVAGTMLPVPTRRVDRRAFVPNP